MNMVELSERRMMALGIVLLAMVAGVLAVPPLPCEYYGEVLVDGIPAPAGTVITATINGTVKGQVVLESPGQLGGLGPFDRRLVVIVTGDDLAATTNPTVNFTVDGVCTNGFFASAFSSGSTVEVSLRSRSIREFPGYQQKPADPDNDGIFEDLNGNGRLDFADVVLYFNEMQWIAGNEPVCAFDLNGNGRIDFADIVALFSKV